MVHSDVFGEVPGSCIAAASSVLLRAASYMNGSVPSLLIDVLKCERCGARRQVLWPAVPPGPIARELLAHLGLDAAPPELAPARGPPWEESWAS